MVKYGHNIFHRNFKVMLKYKHKEITVNVCHRTCISLLFKYLFLMFLYGMI